MNILVVDDEYYIVQGILQNINWKDLGIAKVFGAYSMNQAIEIFKENKIHILLTDIEMPKQSGLDLIEWVNEQNYHPVKILLTGHENFSYAQKALHLGCKQYLVKPVQPQKLQSCLLDAIRSCKEKEDLDKATRLAASWEEEQGNKFTLFWSEIFATTSVLSNKALTNALERYNLPLQWSDQTFRILYIEQYTNPAFQGKVPSSSLLSLKDILSEYQEAQKEFLYSQDSKHVLLIFSENDGPVENILHHIKKYQEQSKYLVFVTEPNYLNGFGQLYHEIQTFTQKIFIRETMLLSYEQALSSVLQEIKKPNFDQWSDWIVLKQTAKILEEIQQIFPFEASLYSLQDLETLYQGLLYSIMKAFEKSGIDSGRFFDQYPHYFDKDKIKEHSAYFVLLIQQELAKVTLHLQDQSESNPFLSAITQYVQEHLASSDLNRNTIAEIVHMNPDYVSYLFHKLTGEHLSSYINNKRIEAAKKLLLSGSYSLQEISEQVGFANSSYFHRQFKKVVGMTPQQYRSR